jgi:hypothetical protein
MDWLVDRGAKVSIQFVLTQASSQVLSGGGSTCKPRKLNVKGVSSSLR